MKKNSKSQNRHPGRPQYQVKWPRGKFTFTDLETENGVNPDTGKGKFCTTLTLRKNLKKELAKKGHSEVVLLKGVLAEPAGDGLGRKQFVYAHRVIVSNKKATIKASNTPSTPATPAPVDAVSQATKDYEATKAALLTPGPAVTITPDVNPEAEPVNVPITASEPTPATTEVPS